ncbi:MAG: amidohydrolase [Ignavibacteriales bacterium]|nr:N-substituted formamide deformylase [Ignavibacteriaceae bacterium]MBW7871888.1 amidohydrolase [Ignavibacteria bacterium]MBZ0195952.1 amidohydrolase [Ignavibacteriaceae bacterium]MCZ2144262.1 amidohydrolase [Ignavibacteriales bacterium]WKZ73020.1 MAG: amidohydrolase [Ignavibacteriaceae bacterium]
MKQVFYHNGVIYTGNPQQKYVESVLTEGNLIVFAGSEAEARKKLQPGYQEINLKGALMLPGLSDDHVHFVSGGESLAGLNLRGATSTTEFTQLLQQFISGKEKGSWITGGDWDHESWEKKDLPTKEMIDDVSPDNPVLIHRFDGHIALANSVALRMAGITSATVSPPGGEIVKDKKTGEPTGILIDNAIDLVSALIPDASLKEKEEWLNLALEEAAKLGLTMVHDITYRDDLRLYQKYEKEGRLTCRIYTRMPVADFKYLAALGIQSGFGSDMLKIGSLKAFSDGSLGAASAWFFDPYVTDPNWYGLPSDIVSNDSLRSWCLQADAAGLQISVHAIGDRANSYMLDVAEEINAKNPPRDRRFRIEHAQHLRTEDIARFKKLNVVASMQPVHLVDDGNWAHKRIGEDRISSSYRFADLLAAGVHIGFGSDWWVASLNPFRGIYAAVTRRTLDGKNPNGWIPEQKISVEQAVVAYTLGNAYAAFMEDKLGTIDPNKYADFTIIDRNIFEIDPELIKDTQVLRTVVNGVTVYSKSAER